MRITKLVFLAFYINGAIDTGKYTELSVEEVGEHIESGEIFEFLQEKLGTNIDISGLESKDRLDLVGEWQDMYNAIDERRKMGVKNNGLCLLIGYLLEGIQRRQDNNPPSR